MEYEEALQFITAILVLDEGTINLLLLDPDFQDEFNAALTAIFWETRKWANRP